MLMVNGHPRTSGLGNFYFSPVRLRPVFEPAYFEKPRAKRTDSNLDLSLDVKPKFRRKGGSSKIHSTKDDDDEDGDEIETEEETEAPKKKEKEKKKSHRKDKKKHKDKQQENEKREPSRADEAFQHLCSKLRVSFVLGALGVIVLLACCCALFLRNRIAACCRRCWPGRKKKNPSKANLFDVEEGGYPYQTSRKLPFKKSKKNKNPPRLIDTGTQDSRTTMARAQEEPPTPVGCSPCCKKKKGKTSKKRRK